MRALDKPVTMKTYPGEPHGFYWGQGVDPAHALQANEDADAFLRKHIRVLPHPVDPSLITPTEVQPMDPPAGNRGQ